MLLCFCFLCFADDNFLLIAGVVIVDYGEDLKKKVKYACAPETVHTWNLRGFLSKARLQLYPPLPPTRPPPSIFSCKFTKQNCQVQRSILLLFYDELFSSLSPVKKIDCWLIDAALRLLDILPNIYPEMSLFLNKNKNKN